MTDRQQRSRPVCRSGSCTGELIVHIASTGRGAARSSAALVRGVRRGGALEATSSSADRASRRRLTYMRRPRQLARLLCCPATRDESCFPSAPGVETLCDEPRWPRGWERSLCRKSASERRPLRVTRVVRGTCETIRVRSAGVSDGSPLRGFPSDLAAGSTLAVIRNAGRPDHFAFDRGDSAIETVVERYRHFESGWRDASATRFRRAGLLAGGRA